MSPPGKVYEDQLRDVLSVQKGTNVASDQGANLMSFLANAENRTVHDWISREGPFDRAGSGMYTFGINLALSPGRLDYSNSALAPTRLDYSNPDSLGPQDDAFVDLLAGAASFENDLARRVIAAALRGFFAEARTQLSARHKAEAFRKTQEELTQPRSIAAFTGGYLAGSLAGLVSPMTDLFGLPAFVDEVERFIMNAATSIYTNAPRLLLEGEKLVIEMHRELINALIALSTQLADPNYRLLLFEFVGDTAVQFASQQGHNAAKAVIDPFGTAMGAAKEEEDPGWASVLPKDESAVRRNPTLALAATLSRAWEYGTGRAKKAMLTTESSRVGYAIGHTIGMVVSYVLLSVVTDGIGSAIAAIGKATSKLAPALRTVGPLVMKISKAIEVVGEAIRAVETAMAFVGQRALKPFERVLAPFGELLKRLQTWLGELMGIAEREGAEAAAVAGGKLAGKVEPHISGGSELSKGARAGGEAIEGAPKELPPITESDLAKRISGGRGAVNTNVELPTGTGASGTGASKVESTGSVLSIPKERIGTGGPHPGYKPGPRPVTRLPFRQGEPVPPAPPTVPAAQVQLAEEQALLSTGTGGPPPTTKRADPQVSPRASLNEPKVVEKVPGPDKKPSQAAGGTIELADTPAKRAKLPKRLSYERSSGDEIVLERGIGVKFNEWTVADISPGELRIQYNYAQGRPEKVQFIAREEAYQVAQVSSRAFGKEPSVLAIQPKVAAFSRAEVRKAGITNMTFDLSHLAPREAFTYGAEVEKATDTMRNIVPMETKFNQRGEWRAAERQVEKWAMEFGAVKVEIWPIYDAAPLTLIDGTPIPNAFTRKVTKLDGQVLQHVTLLHF